MSKQLPDIKKALEELTAQNIRQFPHPTNRASEAGWVDECLRFLVLSRLHPEKKSLPSVGLQRIFNEGKLHEEAMLAEMKQAGYQVIQQQRDFEWKKFELTGHIDGLVVPPGKPDESWPVEIKSCSPGVFASIRNLSDVKELIGSRYAWVRKYPAQIQLYQIMANKEAGIILFKNKASGEVHQINSALDYDYVEHILKGLEEVNEWVKKGEAPEEKKCESCDICDFFSTACFTDIDYGKGFDLTADPQFIADLNRRYELTEAHKEYQELDKAIKNKVRGQNIIAGDFRIESQELERREYTVKAGKYIKVSIEKFK